MHRRKFLNLIALTPALPALASSPVEQPPSYRWENFDFIINMFSVHQNVAPCCFGVDGLPTNHPMWAVLGGAEYSVGCVFRTPKEGQAAVAHWLDKHRFHPSEVRFTHVRTGEYCVEVCTLNSARKDVFRSWVNHYGEHAEDGFLRGWALKEIQQPTPSLIEKGLPLSWDGMSPSSDPLRPQIWNKTTGRQVYGCSYHQEGTDLHVYPAETAPGSRHWYAVNQHQVLWPRPNLQPLHRTPLYQWGFLDRLRVSDDDLKHERQVFFS